jgi:hypothetical protein
LPFLLTTYTPAALAIPHLVAVKVNEMASVPKVGSAEFLQHIALGRGVGACMNIQQDFVNIIGNVLYYEIGKVVKQSPAVAVCTFRDAGRIHGAVFHNVSVNLIP